MAFDQIGAQLKSTDNRVKSINETYFSLPNLPFLQIFYDKYATAFFLEKRQSLLSSPEVPLKGLRSQEQEKEQEKEKEKEQEKNNCAEQKNCSVQENNETSKQIITIPLNDSSDFPISQQLIDEWQKLYPNVDVQQALREIRGWNLANAKKRKTKSGILKHINHWLAKAQNDSKQYSSNPKFMSSANNLFAHNHAIASEWLQKDSISQYGELMQ